MTTHDDDRDLRERFETLRAADRAIDPGFEAVRRRARRAAPQPRSRYTLWRPALAGVGTLAAAAVAVLIVRPDGPAPGPLDAPSGTPTFALGQWAMPTDALLDLSGLPGDALLRGVPDLGVPPVAPATPPRPHEMPDLSHAPTRSPLA